MKTITIGGNQLHRSANSLQEQVVESDAMVRYETDKPRDIILKK